MRARTAFRRCCRRRSRGCHQCARARPSRCGSLSSHRARLLPGRARRTGVGSSTRRVHEVEQIVARHIRSTASARPVANPFHRVVTARVVADDDLIVGIVDSHHALETLERVRCAVPVEQHDVHARLTHESVTSTDGSAQSIQSGSIKKGSKRLFEKRLWTTIIGTVTAAPSARPARMGRPIAVPPDPECGAKHGPEHAGVQREPDHPGQYQHEEQPTVDTVGRRERSNPSVPFRHVTPGVEPDADHPVIAQHDPAVQPRRHVAPLPTGRCSAC